MVAGDSLESLVIGHFRSNQCNRGGVDISMAKFRRVSSSSRKSDSPERLFDDLPRTPDGIPSLWAHQADMLREYRANNFETSDIALELPTGAGKTLPALLIAEWRRSQYDHRVAYACPTKQLADQVYEEAHRQGIDAVALLGSYQDWDTVEKSKYDRADFYRHHYVQCDIQFETSPYVSRSSDFR